MRCRGCNKICANECLSEANYPEPFPLRIREKENIVPNTYTRWFEDNQSRIEGYIEQHFNREDWDPQFTWMLNRPNVSYNMVNDSKIPNRAKIAKILARTFDMDFSCNIIAGWPGSGKTWCSLWLAENAHYLYPTKNYYYFAHTKKLHVPGWMEVITDMNQIKNNSLVVMDEAAIRLSSRRSMANANELMSHLLNVRRHKKLMLFFISQRIERLDRAIREQTDHWFLKPYSMTSSNDRLLELIRNYIPTEDNPHLLGFFDDRDSVAYNVWQPAPRSEERFEFGEAYEDFDITKKEDIWGMKAKKEKKKEEKEMKLKVSHVKIHEYLKDHTQEETAEKFNLSRSGVRYAEKRYKEVMKATS